MPPVNSAEQPHQKHQIDGLDLHGRSMTSSWLFRRSKRQPRCGRTRTRRSIRQMKQKRTVARRGRQLSTPWCPRRTRTSSRRRPRPRRQRRRRTRRSPRHRARTRPRHLPARSSLSRASPRRPPGASPTRRCSLSRSPTTLRRNASICLGMRSVSCTRRHVEATRSSMARCSCFRSTTSVDTKASRRPRGRPARRVLRPVLAVGFWVGYIIIISIVCRCRGNSRS
jgi:hypothetical protein